MLRISYCPLLGNAFTNYGSEITIYHDKSEPFSRKDSLVAGFLGAMCVLAGGGLPSLALLVKLEKTDIFKGSIYFNRQ